MSFGQSRRRPATDQRTSLQHPASRRAAGAMPLPASLRNRTGGCVRGGTSAFILLASPTGGAENCAAKPRMRAERANARNGRCFPLYVPGEPSGFGCWERPQPELSLQLVYLWGATVVRGLWQGTPGGFSRGLVEVPLSALLPPTSWARKKSARLPGRDPAIPAAEGGSFRAPLRGAKKPSGPRAENPRKPRSGWDRQSPSAPLPERQKRRRSCHRYP